RCTARPNAFIRHWLLYSTLLLTDNCQLTANQARQLPNAELTKRWLSQTWAALKLSSPNLIQPLCEDLNQLLGRPTIATHPHENRIAVVRQSSSLAPAEQNFVTMHYRYRQQALNRFLGTPPTADLKIALCCSGGGYRAMIYSLGVLLGLEKLQLLPALTYASALSGATWCLGAYLSSTLKLPQLRAHFQTVTQTNLYQFYRLDQLLDRYLQNLILKQYGSLVLIWSALLADKILAHLDENRFFTCLSDQQYFAEHCANLLPIYTVVEPVLNRTAAAPSYHYHWLEFTPYEVGYVQEPYRIPAWSCGREFKQGSSCDFKPELPFAYLMGVFGSAFTINIHELLQFMRTTPPVAGERSTCHTLLTKIANTDLEHLRLLPAQIPNFRYQLPPHPRLNLTLLSHLQLPTARFSLNWIPLYQVAQNFSYYLGQQQLANQKTLTLIDAGIAFNLPLPPLLTPARQIDLILIIDSSAGLPATPDLFKALQYAKQYYGWDYQATPINDFLNTPLTPLTKP
ncbi:MAG TPA: hypothetical protein VJJ83_02250, partial [Candidatus Babeliales bacterium]|nr:hypothetical protein [Candidatus Babeliales bacterium]